MTSLPQPASLHALDGPIEPERHLLSRDFVWGVSTPSYQIEGVGAVVRQVHPGRGGQVAR